MNKEMQPKRMTFAESKCENLELEFRVSADKFLVNDFAKPFIAKNKVTPDRVQFAAVFSTKDPKSNDYHAHLNWSTTRDGGIFLEVGFFAGAIKINGDEKEPFAESVIQWLGKYFKVDSVTPKVNATFSFEKPGWKPCFPLPIKAPLAGDLEAEIDGLSINLRPSMPCHMTRAFMSEVEKAVVVTLLGEREVRFSDFDINRELSELHFCSKLLVRGTRNEDRAR